MQKVSVIIILGFFIFAQPKTAHAYIDPGSGSYIIQIIIAAFLGVTFTTKMFWKRIKDFLSKILGSDKTKRDDEKDTS